MASVPTQPALPLFYNDLVPLSSQLHGDWRYRELPGLAALAGVHAVPLLAEEFVSAQHFYPIVFTGGDQPIPLALMGLNDGINVVVDADGRFPDGWYVPAYVRRYPFLLARLEEASDQLSLCIDPSAGMCGPFEDGDPVFDGDQPSARTHAILGFCDQFEQSTAATAALVRDLREHKLIGEGEFTVQPDGADQPLVYRGFQLVTEEAVKALRGDVARKLIGTGALALVYAHIFSLQRMAELFQRQSEQGRIPAADPFA